MKAGEITWKMARNTDFRFPRGRRWYRFMGRKGNVVILRLETINRVRDVRVRRDRRLVAQRRLPGVT